MSVHRKKKENAWRYRSYLAMPALWMLSNYATRHYCYLQGQADAFSDMTYERLILAIIAMCLLLFLLFVSVIDEMERDQGEDRNGTVYFR